MRRDLRQLAALIAAGLVLGVGHLSLRSDLPWFPAPSVEETLCGVAEPEPPPAPAASFAPELPMSSPGPEDVP